jgi:hypothetical protein
VAVALTEPPEDVEDKNPVLHEPAKVAEGVRHGLHLAVELANNKVTLHEGAEARIEPQSPSFSIVQKIALERQPGLASVSSVVDEVVEVEGDHPNDLGEHDAVKAQPRGCLDCDRGVDEEVVVEGIATEGEEDQVPPIDVGRRLGLEDDRDERPDVLNTPGW